MPPRTTTDEDSAALRHGRILILILTCGSLGMIGVVWWYYNEQKQATEAAATRELAAVADVEIGQIANWRRERNSDGRVLRSSPAIAIARRALSSPAATPADEAVLLALLERMAGEFSYADSSLVDVNGRVFLRLRKDSSDQSQLKQRLTAQP